MMTVPAQTATRCREVSLGDQPCAQVGGVFGGPGGDGRRRRTGADVAPDISPRLPLHAHLHDDLAPRREARAA